MMVPDQKHTLDMKASEYKYGAFKITSFEKEDKFEFLCCQKENTRDKLRNSKIN